MPYYDIFSKFEKEAVAHDSLLPRSEQLQSIKKKRRFELVIVGGGIHGAALARLAAFNGLRALLLESGDFAGETSSRSSKMAHGGLRYLEILDFKQVREGVRAREDLFQTAPHLVRPHPFWLPIFKNDGWRKFKIGIGLKFYDYFVGPGARKHTWLGPAAVNLPELSSWSGRLRGAFQYYDGIMDDFRLVLENIYSARREGAICLNYSRVMEIRRHVGSLMSVAWEDGLSGETHECEAGVVVNCAGPWAPQVGGFAGVDLQGSLAYSRGSHIVFKKPWRGPALCLPLPERGRFYFVWPHPAGTMVGTTEREIADPETQGGISRDEVEELLNRIKQDLPDAGLTALAVHFSFSGIRALPRRAGAADTASMSRRHLWSFENGLLTLLGGKFTTAAWTAAEGLKMVYSLASLKSKPAMLAGRHFSGGVRFESERSFFREEAARRGVAPDVIEGVLSRHGARVRNFREADPDLAVVGGAYLRSELAWVCSQEQSENFSDVARRLRLDCREDYGLSIITPIVEELKREVPDKSWEAGAEEYRRSKSGSQNEPLLKVLEQSSQTAGPAQGG